MLPTKVSICYLKTETAKLALLLQAAEDSRWQKGQDDPNWVKRDPQGRFAKQSGASTTESTKSAAALEREVEQQTTIASKPISKLLSLLKGGAANSKAESAMNVLVANAAGETLASSSNMSNDRKKIEQDLSVTLGSDLKDINKSLKQIAYHGLDTIPYKTPGQHAQEAGETLQVALKTALVAASIAVLYTRLGVVSNVVKGVTGSLFGISVLDPLTHFFGKSPAIGKILKNNKAQRSIDDIAVKLRNLEIALNTRSTSEFDPHLQKDIKEIADRLNNVKKEIEKSSTPLPAPPLKHDKKIKIVGSLQIPENIPAYYWEKAFPPKAPPSPPVALNPLPKPKGIIQNLRPSNAERQAEKQAKKASKVASTSTPAQIQSAGSGVSNLIFDFIKSLRDTGISDESLKLFSDRIPQFFDTFGGYTEKDVAAAHSLLSSYEGQTIVIRELLDLL